MKLFDRIKEKAMKIQKKMKTPSFGVLKVTIVAEHMFQKTTKKIEGLLKLSTQKAIKIQGIHYQIVEEVDPIIGKRKDEAESISKKDVKKGFSLKENEEKEVPFTLPIQFALEASRNKSEGDMHLLNHMSERSKKTSIDYILQIDIRYYVQKEKETRTKTLKHTIRFE